MRQAQTTINVETRGPGLFEITRDVMAFVRGTDIETGLLTAYVRHTSASLTIQENADPDVKRDLVDYFERIVPRGDHYIHDAEGPDDMPAHIKSVLTDTTMSIPVSGGAPVFGTWQGLYLFEHRDRPHRRQVVLHLLGE